LWHSTMAGGAANIWGNLLDPRPDGMSQPYPNKEQIRTWSEFWKGRFKKEMIRDNRLTDGVCLKVPGRLMVFYKEDTDAIRMNLVELHAPIRGMAVDTRKAYREIDLADLFPGPEQTFRAPNRSDWVVAVEGRFVHQRVVSDQFESIRR